MADSAPPLSTPLLVVDDDVKLCRLLREYLEPLAYRVTAVHNGREGLAVAEREHFDAVVLDVMLPGMNGLDVLRELRRSSIVPVIMLTAVGEEADRVTGLELGADDYLPKPFSTRELLARIRAVVRRSRLVDRERAGDAVFTAGPLRVDTRARTATLAGAPLTLTTTEFDILSALVRVPGWVKSREQLLLDAADRDFEAFDRSIDVHVSALRRKLGDDPRAPRFIETVRGAGYRLRRQDAGEPS
jgi:DNA-binding response OmpR family regulator